MTLEELSALLSSRLCHLMCRSSFEARSTAIATLVAENRWVSRTVFLSKTRNEVAQRNIENLRQKLTAIHEVELNTANPLEVADALCGAVRNFCEKVGSADAIIDITSFRREELLMLLALFKEYGKELGGSWYFAYVGARDMGEWLSGKVTGVRSVIGYPGRVRPSRPTRLVILMGFEVARARSIIEAYEPKQILLGMGKKSESITDELYSRNKQLFDEISREFADSLESKFEFSSRDPVSVSQELKQVIGETNSANVVIAPLQTKLSTIGAGLYGLSCEDVQVCYAPVEEYNEALYSAPGKDVYLVPFNDLFP